MSVPPATVVAPLIDRLAESNARVKKAALAIYTSAVWTTDSLPEDEQLKLWTELRDALGLEPGTATALGMSPEPVTADLDGPDTIP